MYSGLLPEMLHIKVTFSPSTTTASFILVFLLISQLVMFAGSGRKYKINKMKRK
jgi:hypothetical protein